MAFLPSRPALLDCRYDQVATLQKDPVALRSTALPVAQSRTAGDYRFSVEHLIFT